MKSLDRYAVWVTFRFSSAGFSRNPPGASRQNWGKTSRTRNRGAYRSVRGKSGRAPRWGYKGCNITLPFKLDA